MIKKTLVSGIHFYQRHLSRFTPECIYKPSCSEYCILAIEKYGVRKGLAKFRERINRCDMNHIEHLGEVDYP